MNIVDQIQANMLAYFGLFAGLPGIITHHEDVFWLVTTRGEPGNHILRTQFSNTNVGHRITETLEQISQYTNHMDWIVFPACTPAELGIHLEARGMPSGPGGIWMLMDLRSLTQHYAMPRHFRVEQVQDIMLLDIWRDISTIGFGSDVNMHYEAYALHGFTQQAFSLHYIGYLHDQPVTSATLLLAGGIAGIWDVSTSPTMRGHGYGSAITQAMLQIAYQRGYTYAWVWSSQMGQKVYHQLGFVVRDFGIREYSWGERES